MHEQLRAAEAEMRAAAGALRGDALTRSAGGKWSVAEILEHLTLTFVHGKAAIDKALAEGAPRARPPRMFQRLVRTLVIDLGYFPRVQTPSLTRPSGGVPAERTLDDACAALAALDAALARAVDRFGERALVSNHPYFAGMTVRQWRKFHLRHVRHHMRQARDRSAS